MLSVSRIPTSRLLYCSHALSRWGDRMWSFAIGLFLIHLHPQSLILTAIYEFIVKLFGCCFTGAIGNKIDHLPRLLTMRFCLIIQNSSVALASILIVVVFQLNVTYYCNETLFFVFMSLVTGLGIVSTLSSSATKIVIERDWIVVLSKGDHVRLATINAGMRRIDQICLLLAPILSGMLVTAFSTTWAAGLIAVWNIGSFFLEYYLLCAVYSRVPDLAKKEKKKGKKDSEEESDEEVSTVLFLKRSVTSYFGNVKVFFSQKVALIGFCLSLVYLTVLGFGSITVAYLRLNNVQDVYVGVAMGAGAVFGVAGTLCYTPWTKRFGVAMTGVFGAITLLISIIICLSSIAFEKTNLSHIPATNGTCESTSDPLLDISGSIEIPTILILIGVTTLRFGLWMYDLAISQQFQEVVPEHHRNTVGGVQTSLNNFFDCTYVILTVFISDPRDFDILIIISFVAVAGSCVIYVGWFLKTGGIKTDTSQESDVKFQNDVITNTATIPDDDGVPQIGQCSSSADTEVRETIANIYVIQGASGSVVKEEIVGGFKEEDTIMSNPMSMYDDII